VTLPALRYHRPSTASDACALANRLGTSAAFLAGGTELVPDYQRGKESAVDLIALGGIAELRGISVEDDVLCIGSMTTVAALARSPIVEEWSPAFAEAARALGSPQVRNRATIGGNFCRAVSCADLPPAALVCDATLRIASADASRDVVASEFFVGARRTVLRPGELLVAVRFPRPLQQAGTSFERFGLRRGLALAVASVAARIELDGGRITDAAAALGAVAPTPVLVTDVRSLLRGYRPSPALFARAAAACVDAARPISDVRGSAQFRREIIAVLARRAFATAAARALAKAMPS
jgi:CO/xanthine dehydrogenase FAD-binding subunit